MAESDAPHEDTPLRLGNCAVVVEVADVVEFPLPVAVPVVVPVALPVGVLVPVPVLLAVGDDDDDVDPGASVDGGTSAADPHACAT